MEENNNQKKENDVEKIVSGGATMYPKLEVRPEYPPAYVIVKEQLIRTIRGPGLAVLAVKLIHPLYKRIAEYFIQQRKWSESLFFGVSSTIVHVIVYVIFNGFFLGLDHYKLLQQYKLARKPAQEPTPAQIKETVVEFIVGLPPSVLVSTLVGRLFQYVGAPKALDPLPSATKMYLSIVVAWYISAVGFYFAHRLIHARELYKKIHKKHHTYVGTVSVAAESAHPIEGLTANFIPSLLGSMIVKTHPLTWLVWLAWGLEGVYEAHSGYCFAGSFLHNIGLTHADAVAFHDHHHVENKGNFSYEFIDWVFGTMDHWVAQGRVEGYVKSSRETYKRSLDENKRE